MRVTTHRSAGVLACLVTACALAACGSSASKPSASTQAAAATSSAAAPSSSTPATSSTAAPAAATTSTAAAPASSPAKLTKPGAKLHVGQTAKVGFTTTLKNGNDGPTYSLAITVTSITPGSMADFKGISLSGVPKGSVPTYVKLTMANIGAKPLKTSDQDPAFSIGAVNGNDLDSALILTGDFPKCPQVDTPNPFAAGKSFTTCQIFFERGKVTQVGYNGSTATVDQPITWSL